MERLTKFRFELCEEDPETGHLMCPYPEKQEYEKQDLDPVDEEPSSTVDFNNRRKPGEDIEIP